MADDRGTTRNSTIRSIAWLDVFPPLRLFAAIRMALSFKVLLLAALALVGTVAGWRILGRVFAEPEVAALETVPSEPYGTLQIWPTPDRHADAEPAAIELYRPWPWDAVSHRERPLPAEPSTLPQITFHEPGSVKWSAGSHATLADWLIESPLGLAWFELASPFVRMYEAPTWQRFAHLLCCALWGLVVWGFFGGAITRHAAVTFARHENVPFVGLLAFASWKWKEYIIGPLFPLLGTLLVALFLALAGLLMRIDFGILVAAFVWPLVLLGGFVMTFLLLGLFFGFPLMWSAISAEGTDAFGALSHSYSYTYQRPLHYLLYAFFAALAGVLGWILVNLFLNWILILTDWGVSWGSGASIGSILANEELGAIGGAGANLIRFWTNALFTLAFGFVFAYFWCAAVVIYFLLRRSVDATQFDEVFMPNEPRHGLPSLKAGPDGLPTVVEPAVPSEAS